MIAKQFLVSTPKDQKALNSTKLQFISATVKSELFVHKGNTLRHVTILICYHLSLILFWGEGTTRSVICLLDGKLEVIIG